MTRRVVAVVDDFMVRSRIESAATGETQLSFPVSEAEFLALLEPPPDLILVGLAATRLPWPELVRTARSRFADRPVRIVAFGPHKDLELRARALEAGVDRVLANSALMVALPGLLEGGERGAERSEATVFLEDWLRGRGPERPVDGS